GPADEKVFKMLLGYDVLAAGMSAVRVAARFRGTRSHERNQLTDGRIDLARLVGTGDEAPLRMAAIRYLGMTDCGPGVPKCGSCPLAEAGCAYPREVAVRAEEEGARLAAEREAAMRVGLFA
ncbi:DNA cytosine methyltransferase, partial [Pseudofrankia sp. BMG5.37]|nr:DNA cytosine methyltransferase [Pseudofrankia sp. BMG5.37]